MAQSTAQKLGIRANTTTLVIGQSADFARELIGSLPEGASISADAPVAGMVVLFADDVATVSNSATSANERTDPTGRFWIAYRKGANRKPVIGNPAPLHRDTLQAALARLGLDGVTLISLDDSWSAMRVKAV
jgi:hypothetical protein